VEKIKGKEKPTLKGHFNQEGENERGEKGAERFRGSKKMDVLLIGKAPGGGAFSGKRDKRSTEGAVYFS